MDTGVAVADIVGRNPQYTLRTTASGGCDIRSIDLGITSQDDNGAQIVNHEQRLNWEDDY